MIASPIRPIRALCLLLVLTCVSVAVSGCSKSPSGKYSDDSGTVTIEFKGGGKATVTMMGDNADADYTVEGNKLTVKPKGGKGVDQPLVLTLSDDGKSLSSSGGIVTVTLKQR